MTNQRGTWLVVVPDVRDLDWLDSVMSGAEFLLDPSFSDVASLSDAGLKCLSEFSSAPARRELQSGCRVVAMGKVGYYPNQTIRKGVLDVAPDTQILRRYRVLQRIMGNHWMPRKIAEEDDDSSSHTARRKTTKKKQDEAPQATHFVSVPTGRGRIADNLIKGEPWYASLAEPLPWDRDYMERLRKTQPGKSIERLWFHNLRKQREKLMEMIREKDMWDDESERLFVEAFWEILGALYKREAMAVERWGSRKKEERWKHLVEDVRRQISRAKTGPLLREVMTSLISRPVAEFRSKLIRENPGTIWRLIDRDWKRGRDLALLALASYQSKEKRGSDTGDESESVEITN